MSELVAIGGIQPLMKMLLEGGLLHGECLTVTGHTLQENLEKVPRYMSGQDIVRPLSQPLKKEVEPQINADERR
jgi:dihydroxy-acid dehydratase